MYSKSFYFQLGLVFALFLMLMGCSSKTKEIGRPSQDGHPPRHMIPKHLDKIPDAVPKVEPLSAYGNRFKKNTTNKYVALKKQYAVMPSSKGYKAQGQASWYGTKFQGRKTSSGEPYDMFAMTAAHKTLPLPTYAKVTNADTGKSIIVKVNDRGPFHNNRLIDLSYVAAHKLGIVGRGTGRVVVESIDPRDHHGKVKNTKPGLFGRNKLANNRETSVPPIATVHDEAVGHEVANHVTANHQSKTIALNTMPKTSVATGKTGVKPAVKKAGKTMGQEQKTEQFLTENNQKPISNNPTAKNRVAKNTTNNGKIFLQLGSFNQKGNAEELAKKIEQFSRRQSRIAENTTDVGAKYRVRIGPFKNREEALSLSQELMKQQFPKSMVVSE